MGKPERTEPRDRPRHNFRAKPLTDPGRLGRPGSVAVTVDATGSANRLFLLLRAAGIVKGSAEPNRNKVGKVTKKQVEEIAKTKLVDLNTTNLESAMRTVMGTARNMGLEVVEA